MFGLRPKSLAAPPGPDIVGCERSNAASIYLDHAAFTFENDGSRGKGIDRSARADQEASRSDYLAAERTLLAWIRTDLALMGLVLSWRFLDFSCNSF